MTPGSEQSFTDRRIKASLLVVLWNTIYVEAVLEQFRKEGYPVNEEDKARLSPLIHEHINIQGRHSFVMPEAVVKGELRPLRNPADDPD